MSSDVGHAALYMTWELESGDLPAAARRLRTTVWETKNNQIYYAARVVRAFIDAGRANEGFALLSELRSDPVSDQAIAQTYWQLGAVEDGKAVMRAAVTAALDDAERDATKQLPVAMAGVQWAMGDREGAIFTLRRIQQFDVDRIDIVRSPLAGRLALAGNDGEALSLLDGTQADRATLANIVVGQARRGNFEIAFTTLEQLRKLPATTQEDSAIKPGPKIAATSIARNAARAGDAPAFMRADAIRREGSPGSGIVIALDGEGTRVMREDSDTRSLRSLVRAGKARIAVEYALTFPDLSKKVEGLGMIAEELAGLPDPSYDPFGFFDD
jgi:hypothetical protein